MTKEQRRTRLDSIGLSQIERRRLKDLVNQTLLRHRAQWDKKTEDEQEAWVFDLAQLVKECGLNRVNAGMQTCWTRIQYLPSAPEVREHLPPPEAPNSVPQHDSNCSECRGSGWKPVTAQRCVTRCDCNRRPHKARQADTSAVDPKLEAKIAELNLKFNMPRPPERKHRPMSVSEPSVIAPCLQLTWDQIHERRTAELVEIYRVEEAS